MTATEMTYQCARCCDCDPLTGAVFGDRDSRDAWAEGHRLTTGHVVDQYGTRARPQWDQLTAPGHLVALFPGLPWDDAVRLLEEATAAWHHPAGDDDTRGRFARREDDVMVPGRTLAEELWQVRACGDGTYRLRLVAREDHTTRTCAWCKTTAPGHTMQGINAGPSVACRDTKACQGRITLDAIRDASRLDPIT